MDGYNYEITKPINELTLQSFKNGIYMSYRDGIKSLAPLGFSGDTIMLSGEGRKSQVSIRNYSGNAELLITDLKGRFLFYGRFDVRLGVDLLAEQYFQIFELVKEKIETELPEKSPFDNIPNAPDMELTEGFEMIKAYQNRSIF